MKVALLSVTSLLLVLGCGASGGNDKPVNTAGSSNGGGAGASGGSAAGMTTGGSQSQSGSASGGSTSGSGQGGSSAGAGAGSGGSAGTGGGAQAFSCPAGAVEAPKLTGLTPTRVEGVPPADAFNNNNADGTNIEGPVWIGDALYVSEIAFTKGNPPPSRVLKITAAGQVSIAIPSDSGSNGLATNPQGELFGALHKDGSISKLSLTGGAAVPVVSMFMGSRFSSPNDLTFHSNGTLYFSDPKWQAPTPNPQAAMRAYRVPVGGEPIAIEELEQPNGMTLSKKQDVLYIGGGQLKKYPVMADGTLGTGSAFVQGGQSDGMVIDCADNLYTTGNGVTVYSPAGTEIGKINVNNLSSVTNVAFGGADHKTLYITSQGGKDQKGLWQVPMNIPGMPY